MAGEDWSTNGRLTRFAQQLGVDGKLGAPQITDLEARIGTSSFLTSSDLPVADNVAPIAAPGSATTEDCATAINTLLTKLKTAGLMEADV